MWLTSFIDASSNKNAMSSWAFKKYREDYLPMSL